MTDKTRWLGLGPWHEDNESELIDGPCSRSIRAW